MSKTNYKNTLIYKIFCINPEITDCYIGHTTDLNRRKKFHKNNLNCENIPAYNFKVYEFIRSNGGWENFKMEIVEHYPCDTKDQACIKEQEFIEKLNPTLNSRGAKLTKEKRKQTADLNKPKKNAQAKEYRQRPEVKEAKKVYDAEWKQGPVRAAWLEANSEILKQKKREWYIQNKEKINLEKKERYTCTCGKEVQKCQRGRHEQSVFHIANC